MDFLSNLSTEYEASLYYENDDENDDDLTELVHQHLLSGMSKLHRPLNQSDKSVSKFSRFKVIPPISPPPNKPNENGLIVTPVFKSPVPEDTGLEPQALPTSRDSSRSIGKSSKTSSVRKPDGRSGHKSEKDARNPNSIIPKDELDKSVKLIGYKLTNQTVEVTPPSPSPSMVSTNATKWVPPGSELPPCKICNDKSSGLHYGVYTCEACKAFFRRSLKRSSVDFQCTCTEEERRRNREGPRKTTCPKCRYERCTKEGMSVDAIKIGRYTITRKRQNDREVNLLKEKNQQKSPDSQYSSERSPGTTKSSPSNSPYSSGQSVKSPEQIASDISSQLNIDENTNAPKKMRPDPDPTTGMLYRSLQNSIINDIKATTTLDVGKMMGEMNQSSSELTPMEQLFMQPFSPEPTMSMADGTLTFQFTAPNAQNDIMTFTGQSQMLTNESGMSSQDIMSSAPGELETDTDRIMQLFMAGENVNNHPTTVEPLFDDPLKVIPPGNQMIVPGSQGKQIFNAGNQPMPQGKQIYNMVNQPISQGKQVNATVSQTVSQGKQVFTAGNQPVSQGKQILTTLNQPVSQGKQIFTTVNQPVSQGKQIFTTVNQPVSQGKQIFTTVNQPVLQGKQILTTVNQPVSQGKQIFTTVNQPVSQGKQIFTTVNQPVSQGKQIFTTVNQPVSQGKQIFDTGNQSIVNHSPHSSSMTTDSELSPQDCQLQDEFMNSAIEELIEDASVTSPEDFVQTLVDAEGSLVDFSQFDENQLPGPVPGNHGYCPLGAPALDNMQWREKADHWETEQELETLAGLEERLNNDEELYPVMFDLTEDEESVETFMRSSLVAGVDVSYDELRATVKELWDCAKLLDQMKCCISCDDIRKRHAQYLEKYNQKMELLGQLGRVSKQEYLEVYKLTGIELDDRKQIVVEFLQYTESSIKKMILFVKCIPGFTELCVEDQATLLKAARFEQGMMKVVESLCPVTNRVMTLPWKKEYHLEELTKVLPQEFIDCKQQLMQMIRDLGMTPEETAVMRALAVCCPERPGLLEPQRVRQVFERMLLCLNYLLDQRPADKKLTLLKIGQMAIPLRQLSDWEHKLLLEFFEVWPVADDHGLVKQFVQ